MAASTKSSDGPTNLTLYHQHFMGMVSDINISVEQMYPSKAVAVIVQHNKKG